MVRFYTFTETKKMIQKLKQLFSKEDNYDKGNRLIKEASRLAKDKNYSSAIEKIEKALKYEPRVEWADKLANYHYKNGDLHKADLILDSFKETGKGDPLNQFGYDTWYFERKRIWEKEPHRKDIFEAIVDLKVLLSMAMFGDNYNLGIYLHLNNFLSVSITSLEPDLEYVRKKYLECSDYHYEHCLDKELERFETINEYVWFCYKKDERAINAIQNFSKVLSQLEKSIQNNQNE